MWHFRRIKPIAAKVFYCYNITLPGRKEKYVFFESFKVSVSGVGQIFILGAIGYFLVKKSILSQEGLNSLSRLVIEITLPLLIFCQLIKRFSFTLYPRWWIFPLISIAITGCGLIVGALFMGFISGREQRSQFLSLIAFQNSGYLPLTLVATLLAPDKLDSMFIYIFLFLLGFNLVVWSLGLYILSPHQDRKFKPIDAFSPPVITILLSLLLISLGLSKFVPDALIRPLRMAGDCTLPLAMFVVGGNLASIRIARVDKKAMFLMALAKLVIMPGLGLILVLKSGMPELLGLLIVMQLAVPPATSLSVITTRYKHKDLLISQGIFFGHIFGILTMPLFLSLYFALSVVK